MFSHFMPLSLEKTPRRQCVGATALSWMQPPDGRLAPWHERMEYAVYVFLETKEVNSVLCSKCKPDPTCPLLDVKNGQLPPTITCQEGPKPFPEEAGTMMPSFNETIDFSHVELVIDRRLASQL